MNVHLSIDDVITSLKTLHSELPKSVFDIPLFNYIKELHHTYGAVFTLYIFENDGKEFNVSSVPQKYFGEIGDESFLKFGYHGYKNVGSIKDLKLFAREMDTINNTFPGPLLSKKIRLHRYIADADMVDILKQNGVKELLCRDDKSVELFNAPPSYGLTEHDMINVGSSGVCKDGMVYSKTHIQLELFDENSLLRRLSNLKDEKNLSVFTHEFCLPENKHLIKCALDTLNKQGVKYVF